MLPLGRYMNRDDPTAWEGIVVTIGDGISGMLPGSAFGHVISPNDFPRSQLLE